VIWYCACDLDRVAYRIKHFVDSLVAPKVLDDFVFEAVKLNLHKIDYWIALH
jgi:hypothetical protein